MNDEVRTKIEELMADMECPKAFKCAKNGFENLCKANDMGLESLLECLADDPQSCNFAVAFGDDHYCQCSVRVFLAKKLGL